MFGVTIDLSQHFTNYKKKCIIIIRNEWSTIKDLQSYVKEIFKLNKIEFTDIHNFWIPASEPINVLKTDKYVELIGVGIKPKTQKNCVKNIIEEETGKEITNNITDNIGNVLKSNRKRKYINKICTEDSAGENSTDNLNILTNSVSSNQIEPLLLKKRKRHRKTKQCKETLNQEENNESVKSKKTLLPPAKELTKNHLRFDEFGDAIKVEEEIEICFENFVDTLSSAKSRVINTVVLNNKQQPKDKISDNNINGLKCDNENGAPSDINKNYSNEAYENNEEDYDNKDIKCQQITNDSHIIITENKIINNGFDILKNAICQPQSEIKISRQTDDVCENEVIDDVEFLKTNNENLNIIFNLDNEPTKHDKILSISDMLIGQPEINDVLIFKIYRLNENYEPCLSNYICGKLEKISKIDKENYLEIYIMAGENELKHPQGRFSLGCDDDKTDYLKIQLDELYEPRILKRNLEKCI